MLVPDLLRKQAERMGDATAVDVDGGPTLSYSQWEARSNRLARELVAGGLSPGERVGLLFDNRDTADFVTCYMAVHKAGGVNVPLNTRCTASELAAVTGHCEPSFVFAGDDYRGRARDLAATLPVDADGDDSTFQVSRSDEDLADILYTSGTTGTPKGVACIHQTVARIGKGLDAFRKGTFLHAIPICTFAGAHAMMLVPLRAGMRSVVLPRFDAARYLELLASERVDLTFVVPSMVTLMLEQPRVREGGFDALKLLVHGTAPMPPHAVEQMAEVFPTTMLLNVYGLTEAGGTGCSLPPGEAQKRRGSIGIPIPPAEARVAGTDGEPVRAGETGEIWLRSPGRPRHYYKDEDATARTWTDDGWLKTGDIGYLDEDGYLYLVDRKKDLVIRGGLNVSSPEVEGTLAAHEDVLEVAVVGMPHRVLGEDTHAFVVLKPDATVDGKALEAFARERLADFKVPRAYSFVDELPRNTLGKVLKRELRERLEGGTSP